MVAELCLMGLVWMGWGGVGLDGGVQGWGSCVEDGGRGDGRDSMLGGRYGDMGVWACWCW